MIGTKRKASVNLSLKRTIKGTIATIGRLSIDGKEFCWTLEDTIRDKKIAGITAIPTGTYKVTISMSNRFKKEMPELHDVPNYEGVRIHSGNQASDTEGCILVGMTKLSDTMIGESRTAFAALMERLKGQTDITITVA
jgi:hypothetical protein